MFPLFVYISGILFPPLLYHLLTYLNKIAYFPSLSLLQTPTSSLLCTSQLLLQILWQVSWPAKPFHLLTSVTAKHMTCLCILVYLVCWNWCCWIIVPMYARCLAQNKLQTLSWTKKKTYWYLSKLLKVELHQVTSTNTKNKLHFADLFRNCWNSEKLNLKLLNLFFSWMNKYSAKCQLSVVAMVSISKQNSWLYGRKNAARLLGELVTGVARQQNKIPRLE